MLTEVAASVESAKGEQGIPLPSTHVEQVDVEQGDPKENTENDMPSPQQPSRQALSPSSENIFVFFSCSKGNRAHSEDKQSYFIMHVIDTFERYYQTEHLLDMAVEVTNRVRQDYAADHPFPLIFDHDSSYQGKFYSADGESDIYIHAEHLIEKVSGKVVKFPNDFTGIVTSESKEITDEDSSLVLQCFLKQKPCDPSPRKVRETIQEINELILSNGYDQIDTEKESLLFSGEETVGYGAVTVENKKVVKIDYKVVECTSVHYRIAVTEGKTVKELLPVDEIDSKTFKIYNHTQSGQKLVAVGKGCIGDKCIPHTRIEMYQLPEFHSTFTKKFYLYVSNIFDIF